MCIKCIRIKASKEREDKILKTNENFLLIDTETANSLNFPLPYDIGYKIMNRKGEVKVSRSFCIYEIFVLQREMMKSAYYADKLPEYEQGINAKKMTLVRFYTARKTILKDMEEYKTNTVYAYNISFDRRALNNNQKFTTENRYKYFFPKDTEFRCIWHMACQVLLSRPSYIKMALNNNWVSEKGNILTNAECCYRYITKNIEFEEAHKGLDDVNIEAEILLKCFAQHKKMKTQPYTACWRIVQKKKEEINRGALK